jgi:quinol monooxygenase YgiN
MELFLAAHRPENLLYARQRRALSDGQFAPNILLRPLSSAGRSLKGCGEIFVERNNLSMIAVIVEYEVEPANKAKLVEIISAHARRTLNEEPGCIWFDLVYPTDQAGDQASDRLVIFELYRDVEAFDKHRASPNLPLYFANTASLIKNRRPIVGQMQELGFRDALARMR